MCVRFLYCTVMYVCMYVCSYLARRERRVDSSPPFLVNGQGYTVSTVALSANTHTNDSPKPHT